MKFLTILFLLLTSPAFAAPEFIASNNLCILDTEKYFTGSAGSPTISTTVDSSTGNRCSIQINPSSGATEYVSRTITGTYSPGTCIKLRVATSPTVRRKIFSFRGASKDGASATIERDPTDATKIRVKAFYEGIDVSGGECSSSRTMDGTECTSPAQCDYVNSGEQSCSPGVFATTLKLSLNTDYIICLKQTASAGNGDVTVALWQGTAGNSPVVYQRGAQTRKQGACVNNSNACATNADCPGSTCDTSDVVAITEVRFGADDTGASAMEIYEDEFVIDSSPNVNYRIQSQVPNGTGSPSQWATDGCVNGSEYQCIDDAASGTSAPDDDTTNLNTAADTEEEVVALSDISFGGSETPIAVSGVVYARDTAGTTAELGQRLVSEGNTDTSFNGGAFFDVNTFSNNSYHILPPYVLANSPGESDGWTSTEINALQFMIKAGTGSQVKVSAAMTDVLIDEPDPVVEQVISRRQNPAGGGVVCLLGDSTFNDSPFQDEIVGGALEPSSVLDCSRGGATATDVTDNISINGNNNDILDGGTTQFLSCRAVKGTSATCDVAVLEIGVNTIHGLAAHPRGNANENGIGKPGICDNKGGVNDQGACFCPNGVTPSRSDRSKASSHGICRTKGASWLADCLDYTDCTVSASSECCTDCVDSSCASCSVATATASGGACQCNGAFGCIGCQASALAEFAASRMCVQGCKDSPQCGGGVCQTSADVSDIMKELNAIEASRLARPTPVATPPVGGPPMIIYSIPPPGQIKNGLGCWQDIERQVGSYYATLLKWIKSKNLPYINMYARFLRDCPGGTISGTSCQTNGCTYGRDPQCSTGTCFGGTLQGGSCSTNADCGSHCYYDRGCCLRDEIHWSPEYGQQVAAQAIIDCLTNAGGVTHDGVCNTGTCTSGQINNPCSTDSDCDTWSCDFGSTTP